MTHQDDLERIYRTRSPEDIPWNREAPPHALVEFVEAIPELVLLEPGVPLFPCLELEPGFALLLVHPHLERRVVVLLVLGEAVPFLVGAGGEADRQEEQGQQSLHLVSRSGRPVWRRA